MIPRWSPKGLPKRGFWKSFGVSFPRPLQGTLNEAKMAPKWEGNNWENLTLGPLGDQGRPQGPPKAATGPPKPPKWSPRVPRAPKMHHKRSPKPPMTPAQDSKQKNFDFP